MGPDSSHTILLMSPLITYLSSDEPTMCRKWAAPSNYTASKKERYSRGDVRVLERLSRKKEEEADKSLSTSFSPCHCSSILGIRISENVSFGLTGTNMISLDWSSLASLIPKYVVHLVQRQACSGSLSDHTPILNQHHGAPVLLLLW